MKYPNLFSPYRIGDTVFRNRIFSAPNGTKHKTPEGFPLEFEVTVFESRAKGGAAQVTTGNSAVDPRYRDQKPSRSLNNFDDPDCQPYLTEVALAIRRHGAVASIELNHSGPLANPKYSGGRSPIGPSAFTRGDGVEVREMDEQDIAEAIEAFAAAAETAKTCRFNMCMLHAGHGWLIDSFLSRRTNRRGDRWGGSPENRARLLIEICKAIRERCGRDFLIEVRISADEFAPDGITPDESIEYAKLLEPYIDLLHVSAAGLSTAHHNPAEVSDPARWAEIWSHCPTPHIMNERGCYIDYAAAIKRSGVKTPIVAVGAIADPEMAERAIAEGKCDFVAMARALIADPELPDKARRGADGDIRPCIRCERCNDRHVSRQCTVNPEMGRFIRMLYVDRHPARRRVAVVGGGPGGMQAAITAHTQGHDVTLFERSSELGGLLVPLSREFLKREFGAYLDYLRRKTAESAHVELGVEATAELLAGAGFDSVIAAVGSEAVIPPINGVERKNVITAERIHDPDVTLGGSAVIIGGGMAGCETAYELARLGLEVSIVETLDTLFPERDRISRNYSMPIMASLRSRENVHIYTETRCTEIGDGCVAVSGAFGEMKIAADTVVLSVGRRARSEVVDKLWHSAPDFRPVGDCVSPRNIMEAVSEAFFAALDIK